MVFGLKGSGTHDGLAASMERKIYDVVIIGGGIMGSSSAFFLASRMTPEVSTICVIERDPTVSDIKLTLVNESSHTNGWPPKSWHVT